MAYNGSVELISGITQANNGNFPLVDASAVRVDDQTRLNAALNAKQNVLTFDSQPTENSTNPVTSGGVYSAIAEATPTIPDASSATKGVVMIESTPTENSTKAITSGGVYAALSSVTPTEPDGIGLRVTNIRRKNVQNIFGETIYAIVFTAQTSADFNTPEQLGGYKGHDLMYIPVETGDEVTLSWIDSNTTYYRIQIGENLYPLKINGNESQDTKSFTYYKGVCLVYYNGGGSFDLSTTGYEATTTHQGFMSAADKAKLDGIATGANNYTLPDATSSVKGGVMIDSTPTENSTKAVTSGGVYAAIAQATPTIPDASSSTKGIVMIESTPTSASTKAVTSGGVYDAVTGVVKVSSSQPNDTFNKLWVDSSVSTEYQVPTVTEMNTALATKITNPDGASSGKFLQIGTNGNPGWGAGASTQDIVDTVGDWLENNISGETDITLDSSLLVNGAAANSAVVGREVNALKSALLQLAQKVAYIDNGGSGYYSNLYNTLYPRHVDTDYITNGLIHYYDGIDNTRNGHDASAVVWEDLIGTNTLTPDSAAAISWASDAIVMSGSLLQRLVSAQNATDAENKTVEIVFTVSSSQLAVLVNAFYDPTDPSGNNRRAVGSIILFSDNTFNVVGRSETSYTTGVNAITGLHHLAGSFSDAETVSAAYANGVSRSKGSDTHVLRSIDSRMTVGTAADGASYPLTGRIHAIRIYDRILSAAEIASNYAIDVQRFGFT